MAESFVDILIGLPKEVAQHILGYLSLQDLASAQQVAESLILGS